MSIEGSDRVERVREVVDEILRRQPDLSYRRGGFVHLYGVAQSAALLVLKRGLEPELAAIAGMLHDISTHQTGDSTEHGLRSSEIAHGILASLGCFGKEQRELICEAIARHRLKDETHGPYDELLKDADVLQHFLYAPWLGRIEKENPRLVGLRQELGLG